MKNPVVRRKKVEGSPQPEGKSEEKIKMAFYLPRKSAETLEEIRLQLIRQGRSRRNAGQSNLVAEAISLLERKYILLK